MAPDVDLWLLHTGNHRCIQVKETNGSPDDSPELFSDLGMTLSQHRGPHMGMVPDSGCQSWQSGPSNAQRWVITM